MGLSWEKLAEISKDKALLLYKRVTTFREVRYNVTGKNLLYCNFDSFLHVYLRHVEDLKVSNQFENRDKFQLHEEDVMIVMGHVMEALNDEYQKYKNEHPDGRFYRAGKMAYYYNGDYDKYSLHFSRYILPIVLKQHFIFCLLWLYTHYIIDRQISYSILHLHLLSIG